jgi:phospho-2-dehydro-3-deoxyheptonate aldolase
MKIDCSHGNSNKQHQRQIDVAEDIVSAFMALKDVRIVTLSLRLANLNLPTLPPSSWVS